MSISFQSIGKRTVRLSYGAVQSSELKRRNAEQVSKERAKIAALLPSERNTARTVQSLGATVEQLYACPERARADGLIGELINRGKVKQVTREGYACFVSFTSEPACRATHEWLSRSGIGYTGIWSENDKYQCSAKLQRAGHIPIRQQFGIMLSGKGGSRHGLESLDDSEDSNSFFDSATAHVENHSLHGGWVSPVKFASATERETVLKNSEAREMDICEPWDACPDAFSGLRGLRAALADGNLLAQSVGWEQHVPTYTHTGRLTGAFSQPREIEPKPCNLKKVARWASERISDSRRVSEIKARESLLYRARLRAARARQRYEELRGAVREYRQLEPGWRSGELERELMFLRDMADTKRRVVTRLESAAAKARENDVKIVFRETFPEHAPKRKSGMKPGALVPLTSAERMQLKKARDSGIELSIARHKADNAHLDSLQGAEREQFNPQIALSQIWEQEQTHNGAVTTPLRLGVESDS